MENASKALIIAGAILLSIAIIGIGMSVFNIGKDTADKINMNEQEMAQFNSKFESYEGNKKGSNVKQLITAIITNNAAEDSRKVKVTTVRTAAGASISVKTNAIDSADLTDIRKTLKANTPYDISIAYVSGLVDTITITE